MPEFEERRIVVGVDGTASSLAAGRWAAAEAVRHRVGLRIVNTYQLPTDVYPAPGSNLGVLTEGARMWSEQVVDEAAAELRAAYPELPLEAVSRVGHPVRVLLAESGQAIITVVGSHGTHQFSDALLGSVAVRVAGHARSPVVVVRPEPAPATAPVGPVIVGVDDSPDAQAAIGFAFEEAASRGTRLLAVHTWDDQPITRALAAMPLPLSLDRLAESERRLLAEQLAGWADKYPDVPVEQHVLTGHPAENLLDSSGPPLTQPAQLLVVGSRGRGGFAGLLLGSTSAALIAHAKCPVAVVRSSSQTQ